jgi:hypothetical protein
MMKPTRRALGCLGTYSIAYASGIGVLKDLAINTPMIPLNKIPGTKL